MELFGIILSVPAAFIASVVYSWLLNRLVWAHVNLRRAIRLLSFVVLGLIVVEVVVLASLGAVGARTTCGPMFWYLHSVLFFAAVPSLANVLMLKKTKPGWWYLLGVGCACAVFALPVVLMQYGVSEALFGVNGKAGPFRAPK